MKKYNLRCFGYKNQFTISLDIFNNNDKSTDFLKNQNLNRM